MISVLPPNFGDCSPHSASTGFRPPNPYCLPPILLPCNVGITLKSTNEMSRISFPGHTAAFGSPLRGYFHKTLSKIRTLHLLSLLRASYVLLLVTAFV